MISYHCDVCKKDVSATVKPSYFMNISMITPIKDNYGYRYETKAKPLRDNLLICYECGVDKFGMLDCIGEDKQ